MTNPNEKYGREFMDLEIGADLIPLSELAVTACDKTPGPQASLGSTQGAVGQEAPTLVDQEDIDALLGLTKRSTGIDLIDRELLVKAKAEIERLQAGLLKANSNHEHFEREWYLRGDEIERLQEERDELKRQLGNLLAIIHRDGGHYQDQHGTSKAVDDAHLVWAGLITKAESCPPEAVLKALHGLMDRHDFPLFNQQKVTHFMWGALDRIVLSLAKWKAGKTPKEGE